MTTNDTSDSNTDQPGSIQVTECVVTVEGRKNKWKEKLKNRRENWSHSYHHIKHSVWVYLYVKYNSRAHAEVALDGNQILCHYQFRLSEIIYK